MFCCKHVFPLRDPHSTPTIRLQKCSRAEVAEGPALKGRRL